MVKETDHTQDQEETLMEFPCDFPIKAMGLASEEFDSRVVNIIRKYTDDLHEGAVTTRSSKGGKYLSVTVVIQATSRQQLDDIYIELSADEKVIMAL